MVWLTNNSAVPPGGFCLTLTVNEPSAEVVGVAFSFERQAFGPAYSAGTESHSRGCESTICALNDAVINFTCEVRGAHMRLPAQSPHRIGSSKTVVRLHAGPGPVSSAVLCEARPLDANKKAAALAAQ
jgi:hypothetical protein